MGRADEHDGGDLELMSPSLRHEETRFRFDLFLVALARALGFKFRGLASTTWKKAGAEKAKEADSCYYIANFGLVRGKEIDLTVDPPPDLAIEIEVSRSAINSLNIYAAIGVRKSGGSTARPSIFMKGRPMAAMPRAIEARPFHSSNPTKS